MAIKNENYNSSEKDENQNNRNESRSRAEEVRSNYASGNDPQHYGNLSRENQSFSDPESKWQRTGQTSDQSWWNSGTEQQQQVFRGDSQYPYRENNWGRNQQGQAGIENYYPQEPASDRQRQNFAEGSQYPYEGGYEARNLQAREGIERASEWKGPDQNTRTSRQQNNHNNEPQTYGGTNQYPYGGNFGERSRQGAIDEQKREGRQDPYGGNYGQRSPEGGRQEQQKGYEHPRDYTPGWVRNQKLGSPQPGLEEGAGRSNQHPFNNFNRTTNQNQNTMRSDERNFGNNYNDYRYEDYGRERDRFENRGERGEERDYGYGSGVREENNGRREEGWARSGQDRNYRVYGQEQENDNRRDWQRERDYRQSGGYDRSGEGDYGHFRSTETDYPGRRYSNEQDMNRNAGNFYRDSGRDRNYGREGRSYQQERGYGGERDYGVSSSHTASGPYEDFERDVERYDINRGNYNRDRRDQTALSGRRNHESRLSETDPYRYSEGFQDRNQRFEPGREEQGRGGNRNANFSQSEEAQRRRRFPVRNQDQDLERSPSGNWGPSNYERGRNRDYDRDFNEDRRRY